MATHLHYLLVCTNKTPNATLGCESLNDVIKLAPEFAAEHDAKEVLIYEFYDVGRVGFTLYKHNDTHAVPKRNNKRWTAQEDAALMTLVNEMRAKKQSISYDDIGANLFRTPHAVEQRYSFLMQERK